MRRSIAVLLLACLSAAPPEARAAALAVDRAAQTDLMVTVYNDDLGLVKDVRTASLPAGVHEIQFADVASHIDPTSVHLVSLTTPLGLRILEQNYEYDLLTSDKLLEKYVGKMVRLYQSDGTYHDARLLSTAGPIFEINGQVHLGHHGRLVLPALPENLVARPTLVWLLRNQSPAPQNVQASYLTGGLSWKADYVMVVDARETRSDLTGWVTIQNRSGATYANAALKLVAGEVHRARNERRAARALELAAKAPSVADATRDFRSEGFFEYHLYTLDGRTTIKDNQTKQLTLLSASGVAVTKQLIYYGAQDYYRTSYGMPMSNQKVGVYLELRNSQDQRLGVPLPKGKIRVYKADASGSQHLIGEDWIGHTPKDERVKIKMGEAFDVVGERTQKEWRKLGTNLYEVEWEIALRNHKAQEQTITVIEPVPGDWQIMSATHAWDKPEAHTLRFTVPVAKESAAKLVYRVRLRF